MHPLSSPVRATCQAHLILLVFITRTILGGRVTLPCDILSSHSGVIEDSSRLSDVKFTDVSKYHDALILRNVGL